MQNAVGEHMAALAITRQLHLIDSDEFKTAIGNITMSDRQGINTAFHWHRFNRAAQIARAGRQNALFTGDQPHFAGPKPRHQPVVILTRQQAQRKADHARAVAGHPFKGQMCLAGIGRAKNNRHPGPRCMDVASRAVRR